MDQLICASFSHAHYCHEVGMLKVPVELLEVDLLLTGTTSLAGSEYIFLEVDKASKFPFAFAIPSKKTKGVTRHLLQLS